MGLRRVPRLARQGSIEAREFAAEPPGVLAGDFEALPAAVRQVGIQPQQHLVRLVVTEAVLGGELDEPCVGIVGGGLAVHRLDELPQQSRHQLADRDVADPGLRLARAAPEHRRRHRTRTVATAAAPWTSPQVRVGLTWRTPRLSRDRTEASAEWPRRIGEARTVLVKGEPTGSSFVADTMPDRCERGRQRNTRAAVLQVGCPCHLSASCQRPARPPWQQRRAQRCPSGRGLPTGCRAACRQVNSKTSRNCVMSSNNRSRTQSRARLSASTWRSNASRIRAAGRMRSASTAAANSSALSRRPG